MKQHEIKLTLRHPSQNESLLQSIRVASERFKLVQLGYPFSFTMLQTPTRIKRRFLRCVERY